MNDFAGQDFSKRFESLGDLAEGKFEEWSDCNFMRYGLDRPPLAIWKLAPRIRHTPDYLTSNYLVECQGFGRKQIVHMKLDKWESLQWWDRNTMTVQLFIYDAHKDRQIMFPIKKLKPLIQKSEIRAFPDGNRYYAMEAEEVWTTLGD